MIDPFAYTLGQALLKMIVIDKESITSNRLSGCSPSWYAKCYDDRVGIEHRYGEVFIKRDKRSNLAKEVAAYHVARLSGLVDVAPCTLIDDEKWVTPSGFTNPDNALVVMMRWSDYKDVGYDREPSDVFQRRLMLFDYLIDNGDRHRHNLMYNKQHEVAIDHSFSFYGCVSWYPPSVHPDDANAIQRLIHSGSNLLALLHPLLEEDALRGFVERLMSLHSAEEVNNDV